MKKIAVYCSSMADAAPGVEEMGRALGRWIGANSHTLVYGGVNAGLMHTVAEAASVAGAQIIGVVPEVFRSRADELCNELILTSDLNTRKAAMIELADIFVVLPGGIGTIDEWISTLSHIMVMERTDPGYDKPIVAVNLRGMYYGLVRQLADTSDSPFARGRRIDRTIYATDTASLLQVLDRLTHRPS